MFNSVRGVIARGERTEAAARLLDRKDPLNAAKAQFETPGRLRFTEEAILPGAGVGDYLDLSSSSLGPTPKSSRRRAQLPLARPGEPESSPFLMGLAGEKAAAAELAADCCKSLARLLSVPASDVYLFGSMSVRLALEILVRPARANRPVLVADCIAGSFFCENSQVVAFDSLEETVSTGPACLVVAPLLHPETMRSLDIRELATAAQETASTLILEISDAIGIGSFPLDCCGADAVIFSTERHLSGGSDPLVGLYSPQAEFVATLSAYEVGACSSRMGSLRASLDIFDAFSMRDLEDKLAALTTYAVHLLFRLVPENKGKACWISPSPGCVILDLSPAQLQALLERRVLVDIRSHHKVVATFMPLHTSFVDVFRFVERLRSVMIANV